MLLDLVDYIYSALLWWNHRGRRGIHFYMQNDLKARSVLVFKANKCFFDHMPRKAFHLVKDLLKSRCYMMTIF